MATNDTLRPIMAPPLSGPGQADLEAPELRLIYDTAPIGLAFLSPDCRYLQVNQRLTEICGISVADHIGRTVRETVPALADAIEGIVHSILRTGEPVVGVEVAGQRRDEARERYWVTSWHPLRGSSGEIAGINVAAEEITERKRTEAALRASEQHARLIVDELSHRTRNLLTVVKAVASQTARHSDDVAQYHERFVDRLQALSDCHALLANDQWQGATFGDLIATQLKPFQEAAEGQIETAGPALMLRPDAVHYLGLAFHELATNALKHGALSVPKGLVSICWNGTAGRIQVQWRESDGPRVGPPRRRGFGHVVIERIVPRALSGEGALSFSPSGVSWTLDFPETPGDAR